MTFAFWRFIFVETKTLITMETKKDNRAFALEYLSQLIPEIWRVMDETQRAIMAEMIGFVKGVIKLILRRRYNVMNAKEKAMLSNGDQLLK